MTCEQCQELISSFLDNELENSTSSAVQTHLTLCAPCAKLCEDFAVILDFCNVEETAEVLPPNSKALWCRINNIIETEIQPEIIQEQRINQTQPVKTSGWQFTLPQIVSSMLGIALISSLLTIVGIKNYAAGENLNADGTVQASVLDKVLSKFGLAETPQQLREKRIKEREAAIEYWNQRVENRKNQWENHLREVFDRNLREIDQAVYEHHRILQENPQDEVSSEMLDTSLNEKMELLREFSEL